MNQKEKIKKPKFIILSSPSGGGKSSLCNMILSARDNFVYSISYTTRPPRGSEIDGVHYHFIDEEEFKNHKNNGKFIEYARVHDYFYGTTKESIFNNMQNGYSVILDIDVQGAKSIREMVRDISDDIIKDGFMDIFIMPPSIKVLEMRLRNRKTNSEESIKKRLIEAENEIKKSNDFNHVIINDNLESTFSELCNIIDSF